MITVDIIAWLTFVWVSCKAYDTCWDGTNAIDYTGTTSVTESGLTCQAWAVDTPHSHTYHGGALSFPFDGSDTVASNFCRDPNGTAGAAGPWCYTMNPAVPIENCSIPICTNLPCTNGSVAGATYPALFASVIDGFLQVNYMMTDSVYKIGCCGTLTEWRLFSGWSGTVHLQVWRETAGQYTLIGENVITAFTGETNWTVLQADRISVQEGDFIGWYNDNDTVVWATGTTQATLVLFTLPTAPAVGDTVDFTGASVANDRDYAIGAVVNSSIAPYFNNTITTATITDGEAVGTVVYTLEYTDDDPDDVATLSVTMDNTNTYFNLTGSGIVVQATLVAGTETLNFTVTDACSTTGVVSIAITITPQTVSITSLPTTANVSESEVNETLVHTLTFSPTGNYTCTLDAYSPTRAAGNPFLVQNTPANDVGVYLQAAANIRYSVTTSYNVTITCTESNSATDTNTLIISVDPNNQPVFSNFQSSATFNSSTALNTIVYTAAVTDIESDPIVMSLTCDPAGPFIVNNNGEISVTSDLNTANQTTFTWMLTADDGFNTINSSNISVIITDLSNSPVITNLGVTEYVLENQVASTLVYTVSQTDVNINDTPTFQASYPTAACSGMYDLNSTDGTVITLVSLDFETDPSCTIVVTVFDGIATSNPATLTIDISDVDEVPVMSSTGYVIATEEVASGTALTDVGISATDPESTTITLTLNCSADSGYLSINGTSGVVTMTTSYDLEAAGIDTYTISCIVTATDATGQTDTATLDVTITDGNDVNPVFVSASYTFYIDEGFIGFSVIGNISATDGDRTSPNNAVSYSIAPATSFSVGADGKITNIVDLSSVAAGTTYTITATATDGGTTPLTDTAAILVTVLSTTTTSTTTTTTQAPGFFSDTANVLLLVLAIIAALLAAFVVACLTWRYCIQPDKGHMNVTKVKQTPVQEYHTKPTNVSNNNNSLPPKTQNPNSRHPQPYKSINETDKPKPKQTPRQASNRSLLEKKPEVKKPNTPVNSTPPKNTDVKSPASPIPVTNAEPKPLKQRRSMDWSSQQQDSQNRPSSNESGSSSRMFKPSGIESVGRTTSPSNVKFSMHNAPS